MNLLFKEELKKIFSYRSSKIALFVLLIWALATSMLSGLQQSIIIDMNSPRVNGKEAIILEQNESIKNKGIMTNEAIDNIMFSIKGTNNSIDLSDEEARQILYSKENLKNKEIIELIEKTVSTNQGIDQSKKLFSADNPLDFYSKWEKKALEMVEKEGSSESVEKAQSNLDNLKPFYYDYSMGWQMILKNFPDLMLGLFIVISICLSNCFSEDKEQNLSAIVYSSKLGRSDYSKAKVKAAIIFSTLIYVFATILFTVGMFYMYGFTGGDVSVQFGVANFYIGNMSNFQALIKLVLLGYLSSLFMTFIILTISSLFRSSFKTSLFSILFALIPFLVISNYGSSPFMSCIFPLALIDLNNIFTFNYIDVFGILLHSSVVERHIVVTIEPHFKIT